MSHEPSGNNLGEIFGEYSRAKNTIAQVLAALSRGIAELIRQPFKGLKNKLISLIAILLLLFNPLWGDGVIGFILENVFGKKLGEVAWLQGFTAWWPYLFGGAVLLALTIMVWEQLTRKPLPPAQFKNPAIKGLLSFEQSDAEIFKKLQRETEVQQLLSALTHQNFRFGVLTGVSGCGKSSLLKAGLLPALAEQNRRVVIATLTDEPPLESMQKALAAQLGVRFQGEAPNLQAMLDAALQSAGSAGFILILDQFEQFFTQNRTEENREPFIQELWKSYLNAKGAKILLSIRLDFMGRLHEIQQRLQYTLTANQNYFNLRKFKPEQAVRIFHVMSDEGRMEAFDEDFMLKMTKEELASKEDGLVAAADVQWVATALQQAEGFAFDEKTFRQNGGVQGMMQQYLQKLLETPNAFNLRQEALKVLLAFVDLDNNTRLGRLSAADLRQSLGEQISLDHLADNLIWLTQNRLLHRPGLAEAQNPVWELAHERLIEPLRALANKALTGLDQANLLLNRCVNEWLANGKASRFLLTCKEYYSFRKNAQYLVTEPNKAAKEELFALSRKRVQLWNRTAAAALVLLLAAWGVYETTWWKMEVAAKTKLENLTLGYHSGGRGQVVEMLDSLSKLHPQQALDIARKLGFDEKQSAYQAIWLNIKNGILKDSLGREKTCEWLIAYLPDSTFVEVADSLPQLLTSFVPKGKNSATFRRIKESAEEIDEYYRARVFVALAESAAKLSDAGQGLRFLQQLEQSAREIQYKPRRDMVFRALVVSAAKMGHAGQVLRILQQLEQGVEEIKKEPFRVEVFFVLAEFAAKMGDARQVLQFLQQVEQNAQKIEPKHSSARVFVALAVFAAEMGDTARGLRFLQQAEQHAQKIGDEYYRARVFGDLAEVAAKLGNAGQGLRFLQQAEQSAQKIESEYSRAEVFGDLAGRVAEMGDTTQGLRFLQQLERSAQKIGSEPHRTWVFRDLAKSAAKMGDARRGLRFLQRAEQSTQKIESESFRVEEFIALADVAAKMGAAEHALRFLQQAEQNTQKVRDESSCVEVFKALARSVVKLDDTTQRLRFLQQLEQSTQKIESEYYRTEVFAALAEATGQLGDSGQRLRFLQQLEQSAQKIESEYYRADVFSVLAKIVAQLGDVRQGLQFLQQAKQDAHKVGDESDRAKAFGHLAEVAAKLSKESPEAAKQFLFSLEAHTSGFEPQSQALATHLRGLSQAYADLGYYRKAYALAERIEDKYPEKVFALIHLQKRYKERK